MTSYFVGALVAASFAGFAGEVYAAGDVDAVLTTVENDFLALGSTSDRWYTHGTRVIWSYRDGAKSDPVLELARLTLRALPAFAGDGTVRLGGGVGQNIYTPENRSIPAFDPNDRPYGGWLYLGSLAQRETGSSTETVDLKIGVVGPSSGADASQGALHALTSSARSRGWDYQLRPRLGLEAGYLARYAIPLGRSVTVLPHVGGQLGTIRVNARTGLTILVGSGLNGAALPGFGEGIGDGLPASGANRGMFGFVTLDLAAVQRDIFIDGTTFGGHPDIKPRRWVPQLMMGFSVSLPQSTRTHPMNLTYAQTRRGQTYDGSTPIARPQQSVGMLSLTLGF